MSSRRLGAGVTAPVVGDGFATFTPGVSERRSGTTRFQHSGIKNADAQSLTNQTLTASRAYDAFGNVAASSGTMNGPFGYGGPFGYQSDADSGLKLLGHRYYDSSTGRFLTRDPAKDGRNWYGYCGNAPIGRADPTGLWIETGFDLVMLGLSINDFRENPSWENGLGVVADGISVILPIPAVVGGVKHGGKAIALLDDAVEGTKRHIDYHHIVPRPIVRELEVKELDIYSEVVPLPRDIHRDIHSGKGYPRPGGHYNNWWWEELRKVGGAKLATEEDVRRIFEETKRLFGW